MLSRFGTAREFELAQPVPWPMLESEGSEPESANPAVLAEIGERLDQALQENERLTARVGELELEIQSAASQNYTRGLNDGRAEGRRAASEEQKALLERMSDGIAEIAGLRDRLRREAEADLVQLATSIARRILRKHLQIDPGALDAVISAALDKLRSTEVLRVQVHPRQAEAVRARLAVLGQSVPVEGVPSLPEGSLRLETGRGELDASLELQLQEIEDAIASRLGR